MRCAVCLDARADLGMWHRKEGVHDLDKDMDKDKVMVMEEPLRDRSKEQGLLYSADY